MAHYISEYKDGSYRDHVAVWDDECHPLVTDSQWEQMLRGESVEDDEGFVYIIDDEPVERW